MNTNPVDRRRGARTHGDVLRTVRNNAGSAQGALTLPNSPPTQSRGCRRKDDDGTTTLTLDVVPCGRERR